MSSVYLQSPSWQPPSLSTLVISEETMQSSRGSLSLSTLSPKTSKQQYTSLSLPGVNDAAPSPQSSIRTAKAPELTIDVVPTQPPVSGLRLFDKLSNLLMIKILSYCVGDESDCFFPDPECGTMRSVCRAMYNKMMEVLFSRSADAAFMIRTIFRKNCYPSPYGEAAFIQTASYVTALDLTGIQLRNTNAANGCWCFRWLFCCRKPAEYKMTWETIRARFPRLTELNCTDCRVQNNTLSILSELPLTSLNFSRCTKITSLASLVARCQSIEVLYLNGCTALKKVVFSECGQLMRLQQLNLSGCTQLANSDIRPLQRLSTIVNLDLSSIAIDDSDLEELPTSLTHLNLNNTSITNFGMQQLLIRLPNLISLKLSGTAISNAGLAPIGRLLNLRELDLSYTAITDEGLRFLPNLTRLRTLNIGHNQNITNNAYFSLQQLPYGCNIKAAHTAISKTEARQYLKVQSPSPSILSG